MGFDQKGSPVFCVAPGTGGQWDVREEGFDKPLASFQSSADAETYVRDLAKTKEGSTVKMFGQDGKPLKDEGTPALLRA